MKSIPYRRKREGKTDYNKRLKLLLAEKPRLVVRKSNKNILVQLISYEAKGDRVLLTVRSGELKALGWAYGFSNVPAAYLTGFLAAKKIIKKGQNAAIFDIGLQAKGQKLFAALKGAIDGGLKIPHNEDILPSDDTVKGTHIQKHAQGTITKDFDAILEKIK